MSELTRANQPTIPPDAKPWGNFTLMLLTPEALDALPDGTMVIDIFGQPCAKHAEIDKDTRFGMTAYGLLKALEAKGD